MACYHAIIVMVMFLWTTSLICLAARRDTKEMSERTESRLIRSMDSLHNLALATARGYGKRSTNIPFNKLLMELLTLEKMKGYNRNEAMIYPGYLPE